MSHADEIAIELMRYTGDRPVDMSRPEERAMAVGRSMLDPGKLLVAIADGDGALRALARTDLTDPPELALAAVLHGDMFRGTAAIAFSDEPVDRQPAADLNERLRVGRAIASLNDQHLVDWFLCGDDHLHSLKAGGEDLGDGWWDVP